MHSRPGASERARARSLLSETQDRRPLQNGGPGGAAQDGTAVHAGPHETIQRSATANYVCMSTYIYIYILFSQPSLSYARASASFTLSSTHI